MGGRSTRLSSVGEEKTVAALPGEAEPPLSYCLTAAWVVQVALLLTCRWPCGQKPDHNHAAAIIEQHGRAAAAAANHNEPLTAAIAAEGKEADEWNQRAG